MGCFLASFLSCCSAERIFYFPNKQLYADPARLELAHEVVYYPSLNGKTLCGVFFTAADEPAGTVVHFHGNGANLSNHFPLAYFLVPRGFDLLCFDYQGYGASAGRPSPRNTVEDGLASVRWAQAHQRPGSRGVVVFGQSLGAAVACVVAAREPAVKAAVLEAGFTSYRAITGTVMGRSILLWPLRPFFPLLFVRHAWDPQDYIALISPRPVFIIHGTADRIIPVKMAHRLFARAKDPRKLRLIEGGDHLQYRRAAGGTYEDEIEAFFREALKGTSE
ncbi:MAG: alpha/beta hydrolase [Elusimicrobia bacterium]|nr:alpha/beta hydrolase [Elusimicrobiota bacterium]